MKNNGVDVAPLRSASTYRFKRPETKAVRDAARPYRIHWPKGKKNLAYRCYGSPEAALRGACLLVHQLNTGTQKLEMYDVLEVINIRRNSLVGAFVNTVGGVKFIPHAEAKQ
jgi:hypothetical protein